jgi:protein-L-isoaspartate O-methyltransferase
MLGGTEDQVKKRIPNRIEAFERIPRRFFLPDSTSDKKSYVNHLAGESKA